jgi:CheY-like chemotaxis protein
MAKQSSTGMTKVLDKQINRTSYPASNGHRVLMAEDNLINQKLASLLFKKFDVPLKVVSDGAQAVREATENTYDLILMDVQMPVMDGIEAAGKIRSELGESAPAIVALTANGLPGDEERFLSSGMDMYLSKPIDFAKLKEVLAKYVSV